MRYALFALVLVACSRGVPQADGDRACQSVGNCKGYGACWYRPGADPLTEKYGTRVQIATTGVFEHECEARSDTDCQQSEQCGYRGNCGFVRGIDAPSSLLTDCAPRGPADCAQSYICRKIDHCTLKAGWCVK